MGVPVRPTPESPACRGIPEEGETPARKSLWSLRSSLSGGEGRTELLGGSSGSVVLATKPASPTPHADGQASSTTPRAASAGVGHAAEVVESTQHEGGESLFAREASGEMGCGGCGATRQCAGGWCRRRVLLKALLENSTFETLIGCVILANGAVIGLESDARASAGDEGVPEWTARVNQVFLAVFTAELVSRLDVWRAKFFENNWNNFDFFVVAVGLLGELGAGLGVVTVLRVCRVCRLLRAARLLLAFKELWLLIGGLVSCMRTLLWAAFLMLATLYVFGLFAIEVIHPYAREIDPQVCEECATVFSTVYGSVLALFQVVTLDSWNTFAKPIMMEHKWTSLFFLGFVFITVFGLLNLITAVIVHTAMLSCNSDLATQGRFKEKEGKAAKERILRAVQEMDMDSDGRITREEFAKGARESEFFRGLFTAMDVQPEDLDFLFGILEARGGNGSSGDATSAGDSADLRRAAHASNHGILVEDFCDTLFGVTGVASERKATLTLLKHYCADLQKRVKNLEHSSHEQPRQSTAGTLPCQRGSPAPPGRERSRARRFQAAAVSPTARFVHVQRSPPPTLEVEVYRSGTPKDATTPLSHSGTLRARLSPTAPNEY